jgi:type III restriction enzyme
LSRNLRKTLIYRSGVSPLGMLRSCLDYALNDSTKIEGIFDSMKSSLRFSGGRELLDQVSRLNGFRNTCVAHQQNPLIDASTAKKALVDWIDAMGKLWLSGNS